MSALSDYLNAHLPPGWSKRDVIRELEGSLDRTTVYRYLAGTHSRTPPEFVLNAFAKALGCSIVELRQAAGAATGEEEPWEPPLEANRLNRGQRDALAAFIRATVNADSSSGEATAEEASSDEAGSDRANSDGARSGAATSEQETAVARNLGVTGVLAQMRAYVEQLRQTGQGELADRLEASLESTSIASETASKSSKA